MHQHTPHTDPARINTLQNDSLCMAKPATDLACINMLQTDSVWINTFTLVQYASTHLTPNQHSSPSLTLIQYLSTHHPLTDSACINTLHNDSVSITMLYSDSACINTHLTSYHPNTHVLVHINNRPVFHPNTFVLVHMNRQPRIVFGESLVNHSHTQWNTLEHLSCCLGYAGFCIP